LEVWGKGDRWGKIVKAEGVEWKRGGGEEMSGWMANDDRK